MLQGWAEREVVPTVNGGGFPAGSRPAACKQTIPDAHLRVLKTDAVQNDVGGALGGLVGDWLGVCVHAIVAKIVANCAWPSGACVVSARGLGGGGHPTASTAVHCQCHTAAGRTYVPLELSTRPASRAVGRFPGVALCAGRVAGCGAIGRGRHVMTRLCGEPSLQNCKAALHATPAMAPLDRSAHPGIPNAGAPSKGAATCAQPKYPSVTRREASRPREESGAHACLASVARLTRSCRQRSCRPTAR